LLPAGSIKAVSAETFGSRVLASANAAETRAEPRAAASAALEPRKINSSLLPILFLLTLDVGFKLDKFLSKYL
jgi:hypothetical protein